MKSNKKIVQIMAPSVPVFAVYKVGGNPEPASKDELLLEPCPIVALVEDDRGERYVMGLCVESWGLDIPNDKNLCGYATSEEEAVSRYVCKQTEE